MSELISELRALAQRMAAAGETDDPVTVSLAAEEIERLRSEIEMRKLQVTGAAKVIQEEKNDNSKLREERDQLKEQLSGILLYAAVFDDGSDGAEGESANRIIESMRQMATHTLAAHDAEVIERAFVTAYKSGFDHGLECDKAEIESANRTSSAIRVFDYQLQHMARSAADQYIRQQAREVQS